MASNHRNLGRLWTSRVVGCGLLALTQPSCGAETGEASPIVANPCGYALRAAAGSGRTVTLEIGSTAALLVDPRPVTTTESTSDLLGNFACQVAASDAGRITVELDGPLLIEEAPFSDHVTRPNPAFGAQLAGQVNEAVDHATYSTRSELDARQRRILQLVAEAGVGTIRDMQSYDTKRAFVEHAGEGAFDFSFADYLVEHAGALGIEVIARLSLHRNTFAATGQVGLPNPAGPYLRYVEKVVERYDGDADLGCDVPAPDCYSTGDHARPGGDAAAWAERHRVPFFETVKEPEPQAQRNRVGNDPGLSPEDCALLLRDSAALIRARSADARILFAGMGAPFDPTLTTYTLDSYLDRVLASGGGQGYDLQGFDGYLEDVVEKAARYRAALATHGLAMPLWVGQTGAKDGTSTMWDDVPFVGGSDAEQIAFMVQVYTRAFAVGVERVFWGDFFVESGMPQGESKSMPMGLFYTESWRLKPAYFTFRLLATFLYEQTRVEEVQDGVFKVSFAERPPVYVLLAAGSPSP